MRHRPHIGVYVHDFELPISKQKRTFIDWFGQGVEAFLPAVDERVAGVHLLSPSDWAGWVSYGGYV